jgi:VanZ family protein
MTERPLAGTPTRVWPWWAGFILAVLAAGCLTLLAYREALPPALSRIWQFDKVMHFTTAGLLAFSLDGALRRRPFPVRIASRTIPLAAIAVLVPAGIEECLQTFSTVRTASIWDFTADILGVIVFVRLSRRAAT